VSRLMQTVIFGSLFFVIVLAMIGVAIHKRVTENEALVGETNGVQAKINGLQTKVNGLDGPRGVKTQFADLERSFNDLVEVLPLYSPTTSDSFWSAITAYTSGADIQVKSLNWTDKQTGEGGVRGLTGAGAGAAQGKAKAAPTRFKEVVFTLQASGTFFNFLRLLKAFEVHPNFLRVDSFTLTPTTNKTGSTDSMHNINMKLTTFYYVVRR